MKKIIYIIITTLFIFSIANKTNANDWIIIETLDLKYGIEQESFNLTKINNYNFSNIENINQYKKMKKIEISLEKILMQKYRNWEINYYTMNGIIKSHNNFIYHIDKYFYYKSIEEKNSNNKEIISAKNKNYSSARIFYNRMIYLIWKK